MLQYPGKIPKLRVIKKEMTFFLNKSILKYTIRNIDISIVKSQTLVVFIFIRLFTFIYFNFLIFLNGSIRVFYFIIENIRL